ncbi:MAG: type II toxin-antitoxin system RelE/ParE family toxin [Deltaproteobacteria bacterium]|nr:type II toxin-antitoxin system RelE/ParE family toxin [Deltaproteobacteria bacterium]
MPLKNYITVLAYDGDVFSIEFLVTRSGEVPAQSWLDSISLSAQQKFAALFTRLGDHGKIWNEKKFKHLTESDQIFEFKVDDGRVLAFFFIGKRVILTHGFKKKGKKTPKGEIARAEGYKKEFEERNNHE